MEDAAVASTLAHGDGAILLFHTWPSYTHEKISRIVARLREEGATFVTVDQLEPEEIPDNFGEVDW
jgi:peptidoglycan/xylan/chitin deacetylase (PgdA/CDA1 family)